MTSVRRLSPPALAASFALAAAAAFAPAAAGAAMAPIVTTTNVPVVRAAGTCPRSVTVVTTARPYDGGASFTIVQRLAPLAGPLVAVVRRGSPELAFSGPLRAAYATCEGTASATDTGNRHSFTFHAGTLRAAFRHAAELQDLHVEVVRGNPTITGAVAD